MNSSKNSRLLAIAAALIVALLGVTAFLMYNNSQKDQILSQRDTELDEAEKLKTELEKQYYESLAELEEMRGSNEELNALIDKQKEELKISKDRIAELIRGGKINKRDLVAAREQMQQLVTQRDQYMAEITTLKEKNELLANENLQISGERDALKEDVNKERVMNEELVTAKAALVSEKEELETVNTTLSRKVGVASVVKVNEITATGWKVRKSGKPVKKKFAKNVNRLSLCFNTSANEVVESGTEQFHIRIINPVGETLAIEELGSGVITSTATNEQVRYTQAKETEYNNDESNLCVNWEPNIPFQAGTYEIQVYNKGYLAGQSSFVLK